MVSMTYWDVNVWGIDQLYATHAGCNWHQLCHHLVVTTSAICKSQRQCLERKSTALSEVKTGSTWWSTISPTVYHGRLKRWSRPKINVTKGMPNRITGRRINYSQFQFHYNSESSSNPNSNSVTEIILLPSHNGNQQSIWGIRHRQSSEFLNGGHILLYTFKSFQQLNSPRWGNLPRHATQRLRRGPPSRPRFYWSHYRERNHDID